MIPAADVTEPGSYDKSTGVISSVTAVVHTSGNGRERRMNDLSKLHHTRELQELRLSAVLKAELPCLAPRLPSLGEQPHRCFYRLQVQ